MLKQELFDVLNSGTLFGRYAVATGVPDANCLVQYRFLVYIFQQHRVRQPENGTGFGVMKFPLAGENRGIEAVVAGIRRRYCLSGGTDDGDWRTVTVERHTSEYSR